MDTSSSSKNNSRDRAPYDQPRLIVFGSLSLITHGTGGNGTDASGPMTMISDPRAKQNIVQVGIHPLGFGLYLFDYRPEFREAQGHGRQFGVMADEVEAYAPEAVSVSSDGYKRVNYSRLGIRFDA